MAGPVQAVLVGAGNRGYRAYGRYALEFPQSLRFVAVVEPDPGRRERFAREHAIPPERQFADWTDLLQGPRLAEAAVNATMDPMHVASTKGLLDAGYEVLLEKPIAQTPEDCLLLAAAAEQS